jgi:hypothetical protein
MKVNMSLMDKKEVVVERRKYQTLQQTNKEDFMGIHNTF